MSATRKRGRPRLDDEDVRRPMSVRASRAEKEQLEKLAARAGMDLSAYLREAAEHAGACPKFRRKVLAQHIRAAWKRDEGK